MRIFKQQEKSRKTNPPANRYCALSGDDIIHHHAKDLAEQIEDLISVPEKIYQGLYMTTLFRVAEFCQAMPTDENREEYSLLIRQLKFSVAALKLRRQFLLPLNGSAETIAEQDPQWTYAIFSAGLLHHLHKVQEDRRVTLYNLQNERIGDWHPVVGSLYAPNTYFSIEWQSTDNIPSSTLMAALATRITSTGAMRFISQQPLILSSWWNAITLNEVTHNVISNILRQVTQLLENHPPTVNNDPVTENTSEPETLLTDLQAQSIGNNKQMTDPVLLLLDFLSENCSSIHETRHWIRVKKGLFIPRKTLQTFLTTHETAWSDEAHFVRAIKDHLVGNKDDYYFRFRPRAFEKRHILNGIIIKENVLTEWWQQQPVDAEFQPDIIE